MNSNANAARATIVRNAMGKTAAELQQRDRCAAQYLRNAAMMIDDDAACMLGRLLR